MTWKEAKREMMFAKRNVLEGSYIDQAYDKAIEALSHPERKVGHWVVNVEKENTISGSCSVCGWQAHLYEDDVVGMNFCPNCGADMRGESDE